MTVSRPTFAELTNAISKAGLQDLFDEDGQIHLAGVVIATDANILQSARLAAAIADASKTNGATPEEVYRDATCVITTRCRSDGVHVKEERHGVVHGEIVLPKQSLSIVAADLIECMARPQETVCSSTPVS